MNHDLFMHEQVSM